MSDDDRTVDNITYKRAVRTPYDSGEKWIGGALGGTVRASADRWQIAQTSIRSTAYATFDEAARAAQQRQRQRYDDACAFVEVYAAELDAGLKAAAAHAIAIFNEGTET